MRHALHLVAAQRRMLPLALLLAACLLIPTGAAHAQCALENPEACTPSEASQPAAADSGPLTIARADTPQRIRALKRKARDAQARARSRGDIYYNPTGVKDGADRKTPVIDFRDDTTPLAPRSDATPDASAPNGTASRLTPDAGQMFAAAASARENSAFATTATTTDTPAMTLAADSSPFSPGHTSERTPSSLSSDVAAHAAATNPFAVFITSVRSTLAGANAALMARLAPDTPAASGEQASRIGRIFLGIAGLLTAATALRILIA